MRPGPYEQVHDQFWSSTLIKHPQEKAKTEIPREEEVRVAALLRGTLY